MGLVSVGCLFIEYIYLILLDVFIYNSYHSNGKMEPQVRLDLPLRSLVFILRPLSQLEILSLFLKETQQKENGGKK